MARRPRVSVHNHQITSTPSLRLLAGVAVLTVRLGKHDCDPTHWLIYAQAGVKVIEVSEGSNAAKAGCVVVGDVLVGVTAVRYPGSAYLGAAKPERDIFPAHEMNFDTVVEAISSNEPPECDDVILRLRRAA